MWEHRTQSGWSRASEFAGLTVVLGLLVAGLVLAVRAGNGDAGSDPEPVPAAERGHEPEVLDPERASTQRDILLVPEEAVAFTRSFIESNPAAGGWEVVALASGVDPSRGVACTRAVMSSFPPREGGTWAVVTC